MTKYLLGIANLHISTIFLLNAGTVPTTGARSYIFTSPGICKKRREDTFFAPQSESRISAPFFASKTV